jgi:hypothetical protein
MAGTHLTPQAFADGLNKTVFPNPQTNLRMGNVGFLGGNHGMTDDGVEFWFSTADQGPYVNQGPPDPTVCYINHGQRIQPGAWSTTPVDGGPNDPFFQKGTCDSGRYDIASG